MYGLDLFSGIGGISLALEPWVQTVAYCENESYAQAVLLSRMVEGKIESAPIWDDVETLKGEMLPEIDIIFGGFPCQDISVAGNGAGLAGKRSGLFFEIIRLTKEINPPFVFLENVPAIRTRGLREVIRAFTDLGYDCRWTRVSAASVGAPHLRERWFLLAHASSERRQQIARSAHGDESPYEGRSSEKTHKLKRNGERGRARYVANTNGQRLEGSRRKESTQYRSSKSGWWAVEPNVGRVANGVPARVDRLRALGNAVVSIQAQKAFLILLGTA